MAFPQHRYSQDETIGALMTFAGPDFRRFANSSGVTARHTALPLSRYGHLSGFTEANDAWVDVALDLGGQALLAALDDARVKPADVDVVFSTTVTGLAVPTLEARLATRVGLRQDVKRIPLFGLGCVAGAAGVARVHDYLRGFPNQVAALLAVELCSLTVQRNDHSVANLVASSLFGDGAAAVVAMGPSWLPEGGPGPGCWPAAAGPTPTPRTYWAGRSAVTGSGSCYPSRWRLSWRNTWPTISAISWVTMG
ncbi:alpha-pyrone synthesis polyketide synthase-like Pks11 [Mycobacterium kansasii]|uniref:Alpha-pyrone synthesis polyketide synthase-like Pks11 n=1 Tax=Mycobacterium kansasii TaxID=1768 RepID=A0A1V3XPF5_MYCKA|nr:alpha-pyrone synthesis polyketide synthase-like Pks11 [Mycobacterium kansasii]